MKKAMIMEIQRYCIHDGPGIRTTVFFKGCHMSCKWCHNPESQRPSAEMLFYGERCIGCMACFSFCERAAHRMENGVHRMDLSLCEGCGRMNECGEGCPAGALRVCGQEMDAQALLEKVLADRDFYGKEGGVTCSGGEALLQEEFLLEFLPLCKEAGISTCLDTTLNVEWERIERLLPFTDLFLADIKFMDPERHGQYCGTDGVRTVENLYRLSDAGKPVILRMPLLAGINDTGEEAQERKRLLERLANVRRVDCFGVTGHGASKYRALQREFVPFNQGVDPKALAEQMREKLRQNGMGERKHMIRLTFEKGVQEKAVCVCTDSDINFRMNQAPFENRGIRFSGSALLFDGYSVWFEDAGERLKGKGDFSMSFLFAPYGYSSRGDGLFSLFDGERKEGFYVLITKQGKLQAGFGNGRMFFSFDSLEVRAALNAWNMVTVVYGQEAGWCDLYVNGSLANRKQFPRHMEIKWPEGRAYLGRYVDHVVCTEESPSGCFYGLMEELLLWGKALRADEVKELHNVRPTGETAEKLGLDRSVYEGDAQRPQYHLIPPGKWMNEPHGPLYYQGYYHIFYQANPHAPIWDHIQWGHMVSRDMVHWEDMPLALETDESLDPDGCWSGSSLVDKEGRPCIFYTAGNDRCFPNQFVAMAEAVIDREKRLPVWKKCDRPAVTQTQGWLGEFRDPFVWLEDDTYFMLVGTGDADNGGGNAVLYSSDDRESWQCHGFFLDYDYGKNREAGHVFELPVLLPLKGEEGDVVCHIFLFCACQIEGDVVETYGFLGKWDPKGRNFSKFHEKAMLLDLGNGIFTGPSGFVTPDGRTVVFTIAQGKRGWKEEYYAGWAHNGGLPVELSVQNSELRIRPIRELSSLRRRELLRLADVSLEEAKEALAAFSGNMLWLRIRADARLLQVEAGDAQTKRIIYYDREAERFGVFDETGAELGKYRGEEDRVEIGDELVCIEYFLDHSMIEAYLNEKKSITARNYIAGRKRRISLDGSVNRICELELWEMGPAYEK